MQCSRCKSWKKDPSHYGHMVGVCEKAKPFWEASCVVLTVGTGPRLEFSREAKDDKMFVQDASDFKAVLLTRPDFYCAQFEDALGKSIAPAVAPKPKFRFSHKRRSF